jgi:hypothetical protein
MARPIDLIVIHCSASPNGRHLTAEEIDRWHKARGFRRQLRDTALQEPRLLHIGYHYVIYTAGPLRGGRAESEIGAHVAGHNARSIGVCMIGTDRYSPNQWGTLRELVTRLQKKYPNAAIKGHRDLSPDRDGDGTVEPFEWLKTCPGFDVVRWLANDMQPLPEHVLERSR